MTNLLNKTILRTQQEGVTSFGIDLNGITFNLQYYLANNVTTISAGAKGWLRIPFDCVITGWELTADTSGSIVIDIWKDTYDNFPPTVADSITASAKPTLSSAQKASSDSIITWEPVLNAGDYLRFNVDSCSGISKINLVLKGYRGEYPSGGGTSGFPT